jgi:hypothetical protein
MQKYSSYVPVRRRKKYRISDLNLRELDKKWVKVDERRKIERKRKLKINFVQYMSYHYCSNKEYIQKVNFNKIILIKK